MGLDVINEDQAFFWLRFHGSNTVPFIDKILDAYDVTQSECTRMNKHNVRCICTNSGKLFFALFLCSTIYTYH